MSKKKPLVVVKYGSSSVTNEFGMDHGRLHEHVHRLKKIHENFGLVVVSSGSVAVGNALWDEARTNRRARRPSLQSVATLGSGRAFTAWQAAFDKRNMLAGQILVTHRELQDPKELPVLQQTLCTNLGADIVSVVNENDALSDEELARLTYGGDNDGLAAHIAKILRAKKLVILTDEDGLLDDDGRLVGRLTASQEDKQRALSYVNNIENAVPVKGRGGMRTKIEAGYDVVFDGIDAHIASADADLKRVIAGSEGTYIVAKAA